MSKAEKVINDLNVAKRVLCNPQMLTLEMNIRIGQAITSAIDLLKEHEAVVRCKDRKFHDAGENEVDAWDRCKSHRINTAEDNYCSWAVHK